MIANNFRGWLAMLLSVVFVGASVAPGLAEDKTTTIFIVRHADKDKTDPNKDNPPLSAAGVLRAKELARLLKDEPLIAIFVSSKLRTQQTAGPTAKATCIKPKTCVEPAKKDVSATVTAIKALLAKKLGGTILVVGHSDSVGVIADKLGAPGIPVLQDHQYDRMFVLRVTGEKVELEKRTYGEPTPP